MRVEEMSEDHSLKNSSRRVTLGSCVCRSAGSNVYAGLRTGYEHLASEQKHRERIVFLKFGSLEGRRGVGLEAECSSCLLLALDTGFQIWTLEGSVKEVVSRRDGAARSVPTPITCKGGESFVLHSEGMWAFL